MKIYVGKVPGVDVTLPQRGSELAAGYDIIATSEPKIVGEKVDLVWRRIDYVEYETSLYIAPSELTFHTLIHPRSSISKYNLVLANSVGLVDNDYRGMVICRFKYVWQPEDMWPSASPGSYSLVGKINMDKIYKKGDKIAQLVFEPTVQVEFELIDELQTTQRGVGGFGSTDNIKLERRGFPDNSSVAGSDTPDVSNFSSNIVIRERSTVPSVPEGPKNEVITEGEKPKFVETPPSGLVAKWLEKGTHTAPPTNYETAVKEAEKFRG